MATVYPRLFKIEAIPDHQSFFLLGARTTGKSTLIQNYLAQSSHPSQTYDLLRHEDYLRLQSSPSLLRREIESRLKKKTPGILQVHIDEIQKIPALLDEVHSLLEQYPKKIRFLLSGSSARKLRREGANLLAGRAWEKKLYPLTHLEMGEDFSLEDTLQFGSLPPLLNRPREEKVEQLRAYVSTYLKEEIQAEALTRRLDSFHRFLEAAGSCNGELVNMTDISREAQVPRKTVASYYQILEDTLVGFFLPSWGHRLSRKELVTHGKFYFFDLGIVNALTQNLTATLSKNHLAYGRLFEHFCILEFIRLHHYQNTEHRIGFFRTRAGAEVDLIEEKHGKVRAIEIKSGNQISKSQVRNLLGFLEEFPNAEAIVLSQVPRAYEIEKVRCLPWQEFFKEEWKG